MERMLEPELLDELPAADARALRSRRDLRRLNVWMGNVGIVARQMQKAFPVQPPQRMADLGAGDGSFSLQLARRFSGRWKNVELMLVDRQNNVSPETLDAIKALGWRPQIVSADIFEWLTRDGRYDCLFANLFLHHFTGEQLSLFFQSASERTNCFAACETRRYRFTFAVRFLVTLVGCSAVTQHDSVISVRAGFRGRELSDLWPKNKKWNLEEDRAGFFSHQFVARKEA